jgi:ABC-type transport system substrate-binding protein
VPQSSSRRRFLQRTALAAAGAAGSARAAANEEARPSITPSSRNAAASPKTLRVAFEAAEAGFDPARFGDLYSSTIYAHIFEPLYTYDPIALPVRLVALTAAGPAEPANDFRDWTVRVRPGTFFTDHPAFKGQRRELVAADYVYSLKRFVDPAVNSGSNLIPDLGILGLDALRQSSLKTGQPFDYDRRIEGLRALDRYTIQFRLEQPRPRLMQTLAYDGHGALAREVAQAHPGTDIGDHPVGTGPFRLAQWQRGSRIVLERNERYRERYFEAQPHDDDAEGQRIARQLQGRRLPMVDRVEVAVINEEQPRWLSFLNGQIDVLEVPGTYAQQAMPDGRLAPYLTRRGIQGQRTLSPSVRLMWFNMNDPLVGGYTPEKVALRRAIGLGMNGPRDNALVWGGQTPPTHTVFAPHQRGYDPAFRSEMGQYSPSRAKALLDVYGYIDRNGDGWREQPDGQPLLLERASSGGQIWRQLDEGFQRDMAAIGLRVSFRAGQFSELIKAGRAGKLMMWALGFSAIFPDGQQFLTRFYSKAETYGRFKSAAADALYERISALPDGAERDALMQEMQRIALAYLPYKYTGVRIDTDVVQPHVVGYRKPVFRLDWFHLVDIAPAPASA